MHGGWGEVCNPWPRAACPRPLVSAWRPFRVSSGRCEVGHLERRRDVYPGCRCPMAQVLWLVQRNAASEERPAPPGLAWRGGPRDNELTAGLASGGGYSAGRLRHEPMCPQSASARSMLAWQVPALWPVIVRKARRARSRGWVREADCSLARSPKAVPSVACRQRPERSGNAPSGALCRIDNLCGAVPRFAASPDSLVCRAESPSGHAHG